MNQTSIVEYGLGRVYVPDNRDYPLQPLLAAQPPVERITRDYRYWFQDNWWGDQGTYPHCVSFAWMAWLLDGPVTHYTTEPPYDLVVAYRWMQDNDYWPGNEYDGTSVRAGADWLVLQGYIGEYRVTTSADEVAHGILTVGPCVVGTDWHRDMTIPDEDVMLSPTGQLDGGHAWLINGYNRKEGRFRMKQSWGRSWGRTGNAWISGENLQTLLDREGEAFFATEQRLAA